MQKPANTLKLFAFEVLQQEMTLSTKDGLNGFFALEQFRLDLTHFLSELTDPVLKKTVQDQHDILKEGIFFDHLLKFDESKRRMAQNPKKPVTFAAIEQQLLLDEVAKSIVRKISSFPQGKESSLVIPGGYSSQELQTPGHRVFYRVNRHLNGRYSFAIINTGSGLSAQFVNLMNEIVSQLQQKISLLRKEKEQLLANPPLENRAQRLEDMKRMDRKLIKIVKLCEAVQARISRALEQNKFAIPEQIYKNLTANELSFSFFQELFKLQIMGTDSMDPIMHFFKERLYHKDRPNMRMGRFYLVQRDGSCSVKPCSKWLRKELGEKLYAQFKVSQTKQRLKEIESLSLADVEGIKDFELKGQPLMGQELLDYFKLEGQKVLARREQKLALLSQE